MALLRLPLSGSSHRFHSDANSGVVERTGILGVDIAHKTVGRTYYTVVQVLFDDRLPDGDESILSCPMVAEITMAADALEPSLSDLVESGARAVGTRTATTSDEPVAPGGTAGDGTTGDADLADGEGAEPAEAEQKVVASALFDHYEFRKRLYDEREAGIDETHGILVLNDGMLPDRYVRFAFVPFSVRLTAGMDLRVYRTTVDELNAKVEEAFAEGRVNEADRRNMLVSIEQHYATDTNS